MSPDPEPRFGRAALALLLAGLVALAAATLAGLELASRIERQGQRMQELDAALGGRTQPSRPACGDDPARRLEFRLEALEQDLRELGRIVRRTGR